MIANRQNVFWTNDKIQDKFHFYLFAGTLHTIIYSKKLVEKYQIHKAALESDYDYALKLIELKVELNELDTLGHTALHWAVFGGDIDFVKILLDAGANPNIFSDDGVTPKWRAKDFGLVDIEKLLDDFGGKILTNEEFDRTSFSVFNSILGQTLPKEDLEKSGNGYRKKTTRKRWWKFW